MSDTRKDPAFCKCKRQSGFPFEAAKGSCDGPICFVPELVVGSAAISLTLAQP